jgi:CheY-like chemotaxis protein
LSKRILVIDDDDSLTSLLRDYLKQRGHEVFVANSGMEGLRRAESLKPDLITLDIMMPNMDGINVLSMLKTNELTKNISVILISVAGETYYEKGLKLGAVAVLKKPLDFLVLDRKIKSLTNKKSILVVDDNSYILRLIETRLRSMGYEVFCAGDGSRAVSAARTQRPDIILMDYILPDMTGAEVTDRLKGDPETSNIPIIAFSGYFGVEFEDEEIFGVDKFLDHEFTIEDLAQEISSVLEKRDI